jgi:hypothetical protein
MTTYVLLGFLLLATGAAAWRFPRARASLLHGGGFSLMYMGQRLFDGDALSMPLSGIGVLLFAAALVLRWTASGATAKPARTFSLVSAVALPLYALSHPAVHAILGLGPTATERFAVSFAALWPIVALVGTLPTWLLDRVAAQHPRGLPVGASTWATQTGLGIALAISLVFPLNYLASQHDVEADFSYFRVTRAGTATLAAAASVETPVEVLLFYPANSEVKEKLVPYFDAVVAGSEGKLSLQVVDQPMAPKLAEELSVRDNGYVVLRQERAEGKPAVEKFKIEDDVKKAKKELKKLDETFQKSLLKLSRGKRVAYVLTGHGEASPRDEDPQTKLGEFKNLLRAQNYDVTDFGLEQGSASAIPDDAALVVVPAPAKALLPEETGALRRYVDGGGALLVYADPGRDPMTDLLGHVGLRVAPGTVANMAKNVPITQGVQDRFNVFSNSFGTHASVATLSKYATRAAVVMLGAVSLEETGSATAPGPGKVTPLVRAFPDSWLDLDGDAEKDAEETGRPNALAVAVEGPETAPYRVVVVGDVNAASDFVVTRSQGNGQLLLDGVRWLVGDEKLMGETQSEEDVKIEHTSESDKVWFYGTIFGAPMLVLALGAWSVQRRTQKKGA